MQGKMPKAVKKLGKKKPSMQEVGETARTAVTETETREDRDETAVLTDGDTQAGGSGPQGLTASEDSGEKSTSDTDTLVERARHRLML